jgi:hypothetical protein
MGGRSHSILDRGPIAPPRHAPLLSKSAMDNEGGLRLSTAELRSWETNPLAKGQHEGLTAAARIFRGESIPMDCHR